MLIRSYAGSVAAGPGGGLGEPWSDGTFWTDGTGWID